MKLYVENLNLNWKQITDKVYQDRFYSRANFYKKKEVRRARMLKQVQYTNVEPKPLKRLNSKRNRKNPDQNDKKSKTESEEIGVYRKNRSLD